MKILLFNPPTIEGKRFIREGRCTQEEGAWGTLWPPISLASAAAVLEKAGHTVRLRDFPAEGSSIGDMEKFAQEFVPDLMIWSSATPSIDSDLSLAARLKNLVPTAKTCTFGTHAATLAQESFASYPALDYIIRGEPELTVGDLAEALEGRREVGKVPGLAFMDKGQFVLTETRALPKQLDDLPDPAWHMLNLDAYRLPLRGRKFLMVVPTRGCPYTCSFCTTHSYYGSMLRRRSVPRVIQELKRNVETFGVREFLFWSDTFTLDKKYVKELCQAILDAKLNIAWACNSRVDTTEDEMFKMMKKAGCWMLSFGIESSNPEVLTQTHKGAVVAQVANAVKSARSAGLQVTGHFVLGLPGDTAETIKDTIRFSQNLGLSFAQYYCAVPFPGSSLYKEAKEKGWLLPAPWEDYRQDKALLHLPGLPPETVQQLRDDAYQQFYANPKTIFSKLQLIRPAAIPKLLSSLRTLIGWRHAA